MSDLPIPHDREEVILNAIATGQAISCPEPHSRKEIYLKEIYENGGGSGGSGGSGMTPEQVESIIEAKTDLSLSDISTNPVSNKAVTKAFEGYVAKVDGKDLSSNDYSDSEKQKVEDNSSNILMLRSESGHTINVTLDKSTYMMTVSLLNKAGEVLNSKTVDFPMETAFVNASYDKASKTMKFTLESGSTVDVPLGDLVEGLVSQTDFDVLSDKVETLKTEVNNNTNAISDINDNLSTEDVDVFSGWTIQDSNRIVCDISVNGNDVLYWYLNFSWSNTINGGVIAYYDNSGTKISEDSIYYPATNKMKGNYTVPNNAVKARFILYFENGVTSTKYPTNVYLNKKPTIRGLGNAISDINDNLDNLSYGETAGGKNLFKIDTTNWTLTDNGIKNNAKNDGYLLGKIKLFAGKTYKISFLPKSKPTVDSSFTAYIDGSVYSACTFAHLNSYALDVKVEKDYTATSDCELLYKLWGNSNSDIFEFQLQVEEGTVATDYKPYIPSVKMLSDDVSDINASMSDYGFNNVFDGELLAGYYNESGAYTFVSSNHFCSKNKITCNGGDIVTVKFNRSVTNQIKISFYGTSGFISQALTSSGSEFRVIAPDNTTYCHFTIIDTTDGKYTIDTCGRIAVYINNQIDVMKNDVDNIKNRLPSLKYTYLKTGGGNTITIKVDGDGIVDHRKAIEVIITSQAYYNVEKILIYLNGDLSGFNWASLGGTSKLVSSIELSDGNLVFMFSDNNYWGDMTFIDHSGIFTFTNA